MNENEKNVNKNVSTTNEVSAPAEISAPQSLLEAAEAGDSWAQRGLGDWYQEREEYEKALEWYLKAEAQHEIDVCWLIGDMYADGLGVEKSLEKKAEWYIRGAEQGESYCQIELADMYFFGEGVPQSYKKAFDLYKICAQQDGGQYARWALADMYRDGLGVKQSYQMAVRWYNCAFDTGYDMLDEYVDFHENGDIDEYLEKVRQCYEASGSKKSFIGLRGIGNLYRDGICVEQSFEKAIPYYKAAAEKGDAYSMRELGYRYCRGEGVTQSQRKGLEWFKKAARKGDTFSIWAIGNMYFYGDEVPQSDKKAAEFYERAARANDHIAQVSLSEMYANGWGVEQSVVEAAMWRKRAHRDDLSGLTREQLEERAYHETVAMTSVFGSCDHSVLKGQRWRRPNPNSKKTKTSAETAAAALEKDEKDRRRVLAELVNGCEQRIAVLEKECAAIQFPSLLGLEATTLRYGAGTIVAQDVDKITVRFANCEKSFVLNAEYSTHPYFENDEAYIKLCTGYRANQDEIKKLTVELQRLRETAGADAGAEEAAG